MKGGPAMDGAAFMNHSNAFTEVWMTAHYVGLAGGLIANFK